MEKNEDLEQKFDLSKFVKRQKILNQKSRQMIEHLGSIVKSMSNITAVCKNMKLPEISYELQLTKAKEDLSFIKLLPKQKMVFTELAHEICSLLPLPEVVVLGYFWRVIKEWQYNNKQPIMILTKMNTLERIQIMDPILKTAIMMMGKSIYFQNRNLKQKLLYHVYCHTIDYFEEINHEVSFINQNTNESFIDLQDYI